jgi:eukaryotic-like serine/threonine-protein kinase
LGSGGMAQVFLALDTELKLEVAYKRLRSHYAEDPSVVERFKREATNAAKLSSHPNIVQIRDRGTTKEGAYFIVMEYVRGGTLAERIEREGALPPAEAAALALQVARTLGAAHGRGIIHLDIKPQNILLTEEVEAKVADFGIARALASKTMTATGQLLGTPH